jgi:hypothetical protein
VLDCDAIGLNEEVCHPTLQHPAFRCCGKGTRSALLMLVGDVQVPSMALPMHKDQPGHSMKGALLNQSERFLLDLQCTRQDLFDAHAICEEHIPGLELLHQACETVIVGATHTESNRRRDRTERHRHLKAGWAG